MAMDKDTIFTAPFRLINHGASGAINYDTGGTDVGDALHHARKGLDRLMEHRAKQNSPGLWDSRWFADVALFEVIIGQRTDEFMKLAYKPQYQSGTPTLIGPPQIEPGHLVKKGGATTRLQIRAVDENGDSVDTKPHVYIPHAFVGQVGDTVWDDGEQHLQATVLTILCFNDTNGVPYYEDIPANLPEIGGEEE